MDLLLAWLLYPLLLALICGGLGLLVERAAATTLPGTLLVPTGFAALVVVATLTTAWTVTAPVTPVAVVALAALGAALSLPRVRAARLDLPSLTAAVAVFAVLAAPVVLSGEATFAGYGILGDTAIQLIGIDRLLEHGRDLGGLAPSSYRAALDAYFASGYPFGAQVAIGAVRQLTGLDAAWIYQPGLAFVVAALALCVDQLAGQLVRGRWLRAAVAFVAAQAALLVAYALQGSVKELATAMLVGLLAALTIPFAAAVHRQPGHPRTVVPLAVAAAASVAVVGPAVVPWLGPILLAALVIAARARPERSRLLAQVGLFAVVALALIVPSLTQLGGYFRVTTGVVTAGEEVGNLIGPLDPLQSLGIWINGDYRLDPGGPWLWVTRLLLLVAVAAAIVGIVATVRRRAWAVAVYVGASLFATAVVVPAGSPWADGKAFAILSPALLLLALLGAAELTQRPGGRLPRGLAGGALLALLAGGVLLSNAFAYRDVRLAPRDRLAELERIGDRDDLAGPLLTTEFEEYAKHFLRRAAPSGVSEAYSPRPADPAPPARPGPRFGFPSDLDGLSLPYVASYPSIVVRRSPLASRPPFGYERVWSGRWYELWRRDPGVAQAVVQHLPLGGERSATAVPSCEDVRALARTARELGGRLAYAPRGAVELLVPTDPGARVSAGWQPDGAEPLSVDTNGPGSVEGTVTTRRAGRYDVWLGGSFGGGFRIEVDGREVGTVQRELSGRGQYAEVAEGVELASGAHTVRIVRERRTLAPGATTSTIGPLVLAPAAPADVAPQVVTVPVDAWRTLCGRAADWIEVVRAA